MHTARITRFGGPPAIGEGERPHAGPGTSLIATTAVPITPLDVLCATGTSYFGARTLPYVPGVQGVGQIVESATLAAGTVVWFATTAGMVDGDGALAEYAVAADDDVVPVPDGVAHELVAALGLSAVAGWTTLTRAGLVAGERVLVLGASGVVGQVAVQAARLRGASHVVAVSRSPEGLRLAVERGADATVTLVPGESAPDLAARLREASGGGVDVVVDPVCGTPATAAITALGERGRLVNLGSSAGPTAEFSSAFIRARSISLLGYTNNALTAEQRADALRTVLEHAAAGRITVSHEVVDWVDGPQAWSRQAAGELAHRAVIRVARG